VISFPINLGDLNASVVYTGAVILEVLLPNAMITGGMNNIHIQVIATALNNRIALEAAISAFALGSEFDASVHGQLGGPMLDSPVYLEYDFTLPAMAGGGMSSTSFIACVDLDSKSISGLSSFVSGDCSINMNLTVWMNNPLQFEMTLLSLNYFVTFNDPTGSFCAFGECIYSARSNILLGTVTVKPNAMLLSQKLVGVNQLLDGSTAGGMGAWNEVCGRVADLYELKNQLHIDIRGGVAGIQIQTFVVDINFHLFNYFVDATNTETCTQKFAMERANGM